MEQSSCTPLNHGERLMETVDGEGYLHVKYFLLVNPDLVDDKQLYGVGVYTAADTQSFHCDDLSTDRELVTELLDLMLQGGVTPITAQDVVYDWLVAQTTLDY